MQPLRRVASLVVGCYTMHCVDASIVIDPQHSLQLIGSAAAYYKTPYYPPRVHFIAAQISMSQPEGSNNPTDIPRPIDRAPLPTGGTPQALAAQPAKTVFGMRQDANLYQPPQNVVFADDYEKRLPEDPYGEETAPNARIWRVYNEEAAAYDAVYVGQARDGLDVMLVFAGLFSAVVTSFLVQVSQSLQADYAAMSAILLHDLVSVQLSIAGSPSSLQNITAPSINPLQTFRPDSITVWVNGLWVVSLVMSLIVALSAVLVKQWFHHYTSLPSGTPRARSHLRQYRFEGIQIWRVNIIVGLFPIIMHTSLVLFLVGLILFFIPLRTSLACAVSVITVTLCLLYLVSSALPIFFPQCPYRTPLTDFIFHTPVFVRKARDAILSLPRRLAYDILSVCQHWIFSYLHYIPPIPFSRVHSSSMEPLSATPNQLLETLAGEVNDDKLSVDALDWLFNVSSNPTVHGLVVHAIGGLPRQVQAYARDTWEYRYNIQNCMRQRLFDALRDSQHRPIEHYNPFDRLFRSCYFFRSGPWPYNQVQWMEIDEHHITATVCAAIGKEFGSFEPVRDLRKFFCTFHERELHPFIWEGLVSFALAPGYSHCFQGTPEDLSNPDCTHIVSLFLPASLPRNEVSIPRRTDSCTAKLHEALTFHVGDISESVQDRLLDMLSPFEDDLPATLPRHYRVLYKVALFALRHLPDNYWTAYRDGGSCRQLELLLVVLQSLAEEYDIIHVEYPSFSGPVLELLCTIIDDSSLCDHHTSAVWSPKHHALLDDSFSAISHLLLKIIMVSSHQPDFVLPPLRRLLHWVSTYDLPKPQHPNTLRKTLNLMTTALEIGNKEMFRAFIDGGWLWRLAERYIANRIFPGYDEPISAFIRGLHAMGPVSALEFFDYLRQPGNFNITFIIIARDLDSEDLLKWCPKNSHSWRTHRATLDGIIDWCQASNRDDLPFPLENLFNGKVVQTDDGAVSLDEALREMFTEDRYRRNVERAARTIILGEPAPGFSDWYY